MEVPIEHLKNELKKNRIKHGFRQDDIAKLLELQSHDRISHWEKGHAVPGIVNLFKLSIFYNTFPHKIYFKLWKKLSRKKKKFEPPRRPLN